MNLNIKFILLQTVWLGMICHGYNILVLLPFPGPSHHLMFKVIMQELLERGHNVTTICVFKTDEQPHPNYTEIQIQPQYPILDRIKIADFIEGRFNDINWFWLGLETSEWGLQSPKVQEFIRSNDTNFDLVISEQFMQESWLMFAHKFDAPIITVNTFGPSDQFDRIMGFLPPLSFVPHSLLVDYGDEMTFLQRFVNVFYSMSDIFLRDWYYMPKMEVMAQNYFRDIATDYDKLPSLKVLENKISVIFVNSHPIFHSPRPLLPGIINIGGIHVKEPQPLPEELKKFLDEADHGVIYFSLGSYLNSTLLPKSTLQSIFNVFEKLDQRVIWKWEFENTTNIPKNVVTKSWLPQSDILAHKNVVLFISHGGLFGSTEAIDREVPMLIIPLFADQPRNAKILESKEVALTLSLQELNELTFKSKIVELIQNKTYRDKIKEQSQLLKDKPMKPLDEAMYWIEYVIRFKGATHLKSAGIHLTWYQYLLLDVLLLDIALILFWLWISRKVFKFFTHFLFSNKEKIE